nr:hypothetical protein [Tanacetum cinerariifolium]
MVMQVQKHMMMQSSQDDGFQPSIDDGKKVDEDLRQESECKDQEKEDNVNITNNVNVVGTNRVNAVGVNTNNELPFDPEMPALEDISTFNYSSHHEDDDEMADMNNLDTTIQVSPMPTIRIHKDHPIDQEEILQFKLQEVWTLVDLPNGKRAIGTKWVFQNKKDERDFVVYQMDVKSSLLYGKIKKEVYVCQPPRFEDPDFPDKVYKVKKALYGLHQAPEAWYLKGQPKFRLWYPKDSSFDLVAYTDSDFAGASLDRKSTTRVKAKTVNGEVQLQALEDGKKEIIIESTIRRDFQLKDAKGVDCLPYAVIFEQLTLMRKPRRKVTEVPQPSPIKHIADEAVNEEMNDSLERVTTTATSLDAEQDKGNIFKTQSKATPNESGSQGISSGGGPSGEDSLKFNELMELCTKLQQKVLDLEITKTTQALEIDIMKGKVKNLERKKRIADIDTNEDIYLVNVHNDEDMFDDDQDLGGEEVFFANQDENVVEKEVDVAQVQVTTTATNPTISIDEVTLAEALAELKHTKPKAKDKGIVFHDPEESTTTTTTTIPKSKSQDKGKAKMIEEPTKLKKKDQIQLDEEVALKLQAEFDKEQRLIRERAQQEEEAKEQQELNDEEKATLFMQLLEKKRKFFSAKRAEEKRNRPPTQAQQRKIMCTYLRIWKEISSQI